MKIKMLVTVPGTQGACVGVGYFYLHGKEIFAVIIRLPVWICFLPGLPLLQQRLAL